MSTIPRKSKTRNRKDTYKNSQNFSSQSRSNRLAGLSFIRQFKRNDHLYSRRASLLNYVIADSTQNIDLALDSNQGAAFLTRTQTINHVLCCQCGTPILPNKANMCYFCRRTECNVSGTLPSRVNITYCPDCKSYLQPPTTWLKAERDSDELLTFCLNRLKKLSEFKLLEAHFVPTESHSNRIQVRLRVQSEVLDQVYSENSHDVEYIVMYQKCWSCMPTDSWDVVVQVRQHVSHMHTLLSLKELMTKHNAVLRAVNIKQVKEGIDFYFARKMDAAKFFFFLRKVAPVKPCKFQRKLKSQDNKNNFSSYEFAVCATLPPICHDDLVYLPSKLSAQLGQLGPLVICTNVSNNIQFLDPFTLQRYSMNVEVYWREPFEPLLSCKQMKEYIVLNVEVVTSEVESRWLGGYTLADVEIARVSDFGKNDNIFSVRTHLGHILKSGDFALGYDLCGANFNNNEAEERRKSLPDVVLIKKTYREQGKAPLKENYEEKDDSEYAQFKKDLMVNPELRFNLSLGGNDRETSETGTSVVSELDEVSSGQLEDIFADLGLNDDEDDQVKDRKTS